MRRLGSLSGDRLRGELREWRLSRGAALVIFLAPLVGALAVALLRLNLPAYRFVTAEDSVFEWPQFALFLGASVFGLLVALRLLQERKPLAVTAYALFALGCLVVAGEEIAWGQRVFGFATPADLEAINMQEETTVHNIGTAQSVFHGLELVAGLYGSVGALLIRARERTESELVNLFVPPLFLSSGFLLIFAYRLARLVVFPAPAFTVVKYGEWPELCFAFGLFAFAFLGWRRLRERRRVEPGGHPREPFAAA